MQSHLPLTAPTWVILAFYALYVRDIMKSLLNNFPKHKTPRDGQIKILKELDEAVSSGYKKIIISAPTGIGKSYIAKAIADSFGSSFVITATKQLQDQYVNDFPDMSTIKGKGNFACFQLMSSNEITSKSKALQMGLSCSKGQCESVVGKNKMTCKHKEVLYDENNNDYGLDSFIGKKTVEPCLYYSQKLNGLEHPRTILNYSIYFHLKEFQAKTSGVARQVDIFDEAHTIENEIVKFLNINIPKSYLADVDVDVKPYNFTDIDSILILLDDLEDAYIKEKRAIEYEIGNSLVYNEEDNEKLKKLSDRLQTIKNYRENLSDKNNFIIQDPETDQAGGFKRVSLQPVNVGKYANRYLDSEYQIFMSGTIDDKNFAKSIGMSDDEYKFIDIKKSPFLKENREIDFIDVCRLSYKSSEKDKMAIIKQIEKILKEYQNEKGLILTSSKKHCFDILYGLPREQKSRIQIAHSSENKNGMTISDILERHKASRNGVLLSSSFWQGVDLKDDMSRFQIIAKCPYPFLGDKRIKKKQSNDPKWYQYQTVLKLLQGFGRSIRSDTDYAKTFVLDNAVADLLIRNRQMVPSAYHDALYE